MVTPRMSTPERAAHSLELKRQHFLENPATSRYAAMFAAPGVDQPISDETDIHSDEEFRASQIRNRRVSSDPEGSEGRSADPSLMTGVHDEELRAQNDAIRAQIRSRMAPSNPEGYEARSADPAVIHFSHPKAPSFNNDIEISKRAREDLQLYRYGCVRTRTRISIEDDDGTQGKLQEINGGVYVETNSGVRARPAWENQVRGLVPTRTGVGDETVINIDGDGGESINSNHRDTDINSNHTDTDINSNHTDTDINSYRPYVVLGLLSTSTSIPKEVMVRIQSPTRLFKELRKAASKLRPWPIRVLSLKAESGFGIYECTKQGIHKRVRVDQSTQHVLAEMFGAYNTSRRDVDSRWLSFVHEELNSTNSDPRLGKYSLQLILSWSALKLVIWGSIPILLSLVIGFWYMFKSHPGEDPVMIVQTAWGISSYIVTAGARKYYPQLGHASYLSDSKTVAIAILATVTQIGNI